MDMIQTKEFFSEHFTVEKVTIKDKNNAAVQRDLAYCHDIESFVDSVCEQKGIDPSEYSKIIETDDGKDSL